MYVVPVLVNEEDFQPKCLLPNSFVFAFYFQYLLNVVLVYLPISNQYKHYVVVTLLILQGIISSKILFKSNHKTQSSGLILIQGNFTILCNKHTSKQMSILYCTQESKSGMKFLELKLQTRPISLPSQCLFLNSAFSMFFIYAFPDPLIQNNVGCWIVIVFAFVLITCS